MAGVLLMTAAPMRTRAESRGSSAMMSETTSICLLKFSMPILPDASTTNTISCVMYSHGTDAVGDGLADGDAEVEADADTDVEATTDADVEATTDAEADTDVEADTGETGTLDEDTNVGEG